MKIWEIPLSPSASIACLEVCISSLKKLLHFLFCCNICLTNLHDRNYIEVGQLTETILPMHDVRLIAVNDGVDSERGEDDFTSFRNIMREWYAKDMNRKMRSALKIKDSQGYAIGHPPYGYKYDEIDKKRWIIDEKAADVVRHIFELRKHSESMNGIAKILNKEICN